MMKGQAVYAREVVLVEQDMIVRWPIRADFGDGGLGEKDEFVLFADDDERDGRVEV
jgi:hypothetical protein